jgi:7-cyano-7-deazaguanine synthase in queuosine biosynthesis
MTKQTINSFEQILINKRGYVSKWPAEKIAIMIISGGLDSVIMSARLLENGYTIYPLHIERGQTNFAAERTSIERFSKLFNKRYPGNFKEVKYVKLNIPPKEFKVDLLPYTKKHGHPLRDTMLQMVAVQYAASLKSKHVTVYTVFCAVMPEDYFPHSKIESIRATNVAVCQNMDDWNWLISSPNVDPYLEEKPIDKPTEILWAHNHEIPIEHTISCNVATEQTNFLNCGVCTSCSRRHEAFLNAGVPDKTEYHSGVKLQ